MQKINKRSGRRRLYGSVPRWINGPAVIVLSSHKATARYRVGNGHGTRHRDINHTPYYRATRSRRPIANRLFLSATRCFYLPLACSSSRFRAAFLRACLRRALPFLLVSILVSSRLPHPLIDAIVRTTALAREQQTSYGHCSYVVGTRDRDLAWDLAIKPNHRNDVNISNYNR